MRTDIYGNALRAGHCELHPQVAEEYPCTLCLKEREVQQQLRKLMPNYILESQAQAAHQAGHALGLPAGTDITTGLVPAVLAVKSQRDELLSLAERLVQWDIDYPVNCHNGYAGLQALNELIRENKAAIAKAKGGAA